MTKSDPTFLKKIKDSLNDREKLFFSPFASLSIHGFRRIREQRIDEGHRQNYAVDSDRILHSLSYTRYIDKTQVFYLVDNDHITHRVLHVQLVSKISRTIGRFLGLNEDLIEAIALGHDIGHCPFGHDGETYLSLLCQEFGIGPYLHNVQSVRFLDNIERKGAGLNLTLQVLDGILCHDGEVHTIGLRPEKERTFSDFDHQVRKKMNEPELPLIPITMEGCVVRMSDTIAYIGRDIEDAIRLNIIQRIDLPKDVTAVLGNRNGTIVYTLVTDIIENSADKSAIAFSEKVSQALQSLRLFNLHNIYLNPLIKPDAGKIQDAFRYLFETYMDDISRHNHLSIVFSGFLDNMSERYISHTSPATTVRDFIAGMTDEFFLRQLPDLIRPKRLVPFYPLKKVQKV